MMSDENEIVWKIELTPDFEVIEVKEENMLRFPDDFNFHLQQFDDPEALP